MSVPFFRSAQTSLVSSKPGADRPINPWEPITTPDGRTFRIFELYAKAAAVTPTHLSVTMSVTSEATQDARDFHVLIYWEEIAPPEMTPTEDALFLIARREVGKWLYAHRSNLDVSAFPYSVYLHFPARVPEVPI